MGVATGGDFEAQAGPYRDELLVHCYRMLGSVHEAEDLVQETMLRAWRAWRRYDPSLASVRTWLYRIATNACLSALEGRARRPLPSGLGGPSDDPDAPLTPAADVPWLQPFPDARLGDPAAEVVRRGTLRLALVAAMQVLPPRQRAVLILRDVLQFSATEAAALLETSPAAVNSALQRARASLSGCAPAEGRVAEPGDAAVRRTVDRYIRSFEAGDVAGLVALLTRDAVLEMPPVPLWYAGRDGYGRFMTRVFAMRGADWRIRALTANTQPALAAYCRDGDAYALHTLQVLTVTSEGVARNVVFQDRAVFAAFRLPGSLS
ncbi:sigma-70 family RNA polymerase sigma factor [Microbispora sp. ATCC PTA-5024]|uniref:sigma-70 family RNA polymerase sigma factor n=1 Tax=Microbispora sp. ATCC PTA-5024 TaxID=316330 RepID=UPI0003DD47EB|nr:sigma-70 family RNA polymerase sigma factor [Microbispora sp. ATCC PTA-5024]ETK30546.1 RNA polymerase sigma70 factor [Microbispora sp. ATCC PTA-5024]